MHTWTKLALLACAAALSAPRAANAQPSEYDDYSWHEEGLRSGIGVSTILGGGLTGFTDQAMRNTMANSVGGLWDLRVTIGSHTPLGLELGYVGTAGKINALTGTKWGTLVGTTAEAALRWNILPHYLVDPYAFAGIGWQRYDVTGGSFRVADTGMNPSDNAVAFPFGAGLAYRNASGLVLDVRGTFRVNANPGLIPQASGGHVAMDTWEAGGAIGYEF